MSTLSLCESLLLGVTSMTATKRRTAITAKEYGPDPVDVYVGSRMRLRRVLKGYTQEKLGDVIGVTFQQVQKYERGTNRVSASRLYDIARVLGVEISFFFDGIDDEVTDRRHTQNLPEKHGVEVGPGAVKGWDPMTDTETLELVRAYWSMGADDQRKCFMALGKAMAKPFVCGPDENSSA